MPLMSSLNISVKCENTSLLSPKQIELDLRSNFLAIAQSSTFFVYSQMRFISITAVSRRNKVHAIRIGLVA